MKRTKAAISYTRKYNKFKISDKSTPPLRRQAQPRWRISVPEGIAMGPGKRDLLTAIQEAGSISAAAAAIGMSYRRAWMLVETMNRCFREPLVVMSRGRAGGATLTRDGQRALSLYNSLESESQKAARRPLAALGRMLK